MSGLHRKDIEERWKKRIHEKFREVTANINKNRVKSPPQYRELRGALEYTLMLKCVEDNETEERVSEYFQQIMVSEANLEPAIEDPEEIIETNDSSLAEPAVEPSTQKISSKLAVEKMTHDIPEKQTRIETQPLISSETSAIVENYDYCHDETKTKHIQLLTEIRQYEKQYQNVDESRNKLFMAKVRDVMNKLRDENLQNLLESLRNFLGGHEQIILGKQIRLKDEADRIICLKHISSSICDQLLGGDLTEIKEKTLVTTIKTICQWNQPEFKKTLVHELYKKCPYTIPAYPKVSSAKSDENLKKLGYITKREMNNTRFETEEEFLNRMTGLIRLFCKILKLENGPFGQDLKPAWNWIADLLNIDPRTNITAVLIRVFLEELGQKMLEVYNDNFKKILDLIKRKYIEKLQPVTNNHEMELLRHTLTVWK